MHKIPEQEQDIYCSWFLLCINFTKNKKNEARTNRNFGDQYFIDY